MWPGEAALAHHGVLFLADAPEFARQILHALAQVLADQRVAVAWRGRLTWYPAKFILLASQAPCPCGGRPGCACGPLAAGRYRARLTRELGGQLAIWLPLTPTAPAPAGQEAGGADSVCVARVAEARSRARHRLRGRLQASAEVPGAELRRSFLPPAEAFAPVIRAVELGEISQRAPHPVIRVAWTLADLAGHPVPDAGDCGQALAFHLGVTPKPEHVIS